MFSPVLVITFAKHGMLLLQTGGLFVSRQFLLKRYRGIFIN